MEIQERDFEMFFWILHMKFTSLADVVQVFFKGCNPKKAPYRRLLKLMDAGLLESKRIYRCPVDLYVATYETVRYLRALYFSYVPALPKNGKFFNNYDHDRRLIELRILFKEMGIGLWVPERAIRTVKPRGACPDAVLYQPGVQYALEYEYSEKEINRYKDIFERYQAKEKYERVLYILQTERRIEKLRTKIPDIPKKIYFISEEELLSQGKEAVFRSAHHDALPVKDLLKYSDVEATLQDLEEEDLKALVQSGDPETWKARKPLPSGGGGGKHDDSDGGEGGQLSEDDDIDHCDNADPRIYPLEEDHDEEEKFE